jgi:hypothetical protein
MGKIAVSFVASTAAALLAAQALPISRTNPPVRTSVQWTSAQTQQLWTRACADCHSNETKWPWYSWVAPSSWLTALHVHEGRDEFNLSELDRLPENRRRRLPEDAKEQIERNRMPPRDYLILHPEARLSQAEKERLAEGLVATLSVALAEALSDVLAEERWFLIVLRGARRASANQRVASLPPQHAPPLRGWARRGLESERSAARRG